MRGFTLRSILDNHNELMDLWEWSSQILKDTEMKARVCDVKAVMKRFSFFFGCCLGRRIFQQTDNLSKSLQQSTLSAAEGQQIAKIVVDTLKRGRNEAFFNQFWEDTLKSMETFDVVPPELPRKRKAPARLDPD